MFDLKFHKMVNRMLNFRPPEQRFVRSEQEMRSMKKTRKRQAQANHDTQLIPADDLDELGKYVATKYTAYFGMDASIYRAEYDSRFAYME